MGLDGNRNVRSRWDDAHTFSIHFLQYRQKLLLDVRRRSVGGSNDTVGLLTQPMQVPHSLSTFSTNATAVLSVNAYGIRMSEHIEIQPAEEGPADVYETTGSMNVL